MKKVFLIVTLLVLGFGLVACGGEDITPEKTPSIINENVLEENVLEENVLEENVLEEK